MTDTQARIGDIVNSSDVVLFMKGTPLFPQCGFSSHFLGNPLSIDDQKRKLELVVDVADEVWGMA